MELKISVRNIVEFAYKSGSIDSGYASLDAAQEGSKAHRLIQKQRVEEGLEYLAEVPISLSIIRGEVILTVSGRIDGIIKQEGSQIIEEIKTTSRYLEELEEDDNPVHLAQAKCYAYMYILQEGLDVIGVQMTYYNRAIKNAKSFTYFYTFEELESFWLDITQKYIKWALMINDWNRKRDKSIEELPFPFYKYRRGQRELAVAVYKTIGSSKKLFAKAPTGIGKTIATLFPSVKAVGEGSIAKIFYLTAKTSTRGIAEEAFNRLRAKGLKFRTVTITAKEKVCQIDKISCKPEDCPFAEGYYDRIDAAIEAIFEKENFTKEEILAHAKIHQVCPFEFSLDLSLFCDGIICDYNYVFDPRVYLKRFFMDVREDYVFLIDEAHNLVDRGREMFSSQLLKSEFLELKKELSKDYPGLKKSINELNKYFIKLRKDLEETSLQNAVYKEYKLELYVLIELFIEEAETILDSSSKISFKEKLLDVYFNALNFIKISDLYDENYITYIEPYGHDLRYKLFCTDPSKLLGEGMKRGKSTVLFSATLTPIEYFKNILGGSEEDYKISIQSPFDGDRLCVMIAGNISTTFKRREGSYKKIAEYLGTLAQKKQGNYIAFFPSYKYLKEVHNVFETEFPDIITIVQRSDMDEEERQLFLKSFELPQVASMVGFAVMGGAFGEGIDLAGDKLIGAVIVGVGLPMLCLERDIICKHFNEINTMGFEYAYMYPGMNKVLQAVGRVIRTEEDKGIVLLIDDRFNRSEYKQLMPREWDKVYQIKNQSILDACIEKFWS